MVTSRLIICIILFNLGFWGLVYAGHPRSGFHRKGITNLTAWWKINTLIAMLWTILCCTTPMGINPSQNGEKPGSRNQYELITEAFLKGQLYFDYEVDEKLAALENPYDGDARRAAHVYYKWDHAFYNGKYYMYFGVVPVLVLFLPYRVITGTGLLTFHASQVFAAVFVVGVFALFKLLADRFFRNISYYSYLSLCVAAAAMSMWQVSVKPTLYCTAMVSAVCFSIWSIYFYLKAVFCTEQENRALVYAGIGALLGALEFGCRPTVGLSNVIVLPLLIHFLKGRTRTRKLALKLCAAASPYVLVAAGLMWYNAARFGNPLEFGQSYQLTVADQSAYGNMLSRIHPGEIVDGLRYYLLDFDTPAVIPTIGVLIIYPIILISVILAAKQGVAGRMKEEGILPFVLTIPAAVVLIIFYTVIWTPEVAPRYRVDYYYLFGIMSYILLGFSMQGTAPPVSDDEPDQKRQTMKAIMKKRARMSFPVGLLAVFTVATSILLAAYPFRGNNSEYYMKQYLKDIIVTEEEQKNR